MRHDDRQILTASIAMMLLALLFLAVAVGPCGLLQQSAIAAAYNFRATTSVNAGDVLIWDSTAAYSVETTNAANSEDVAGVAAETVAADNDCTIRQDGGRVTVNVTDSVDPAVNPWLVTSTTTGKAQGVGALQSGIFARAITSSGTPAAGQVYASLNLGFLGYGSGGGSSDHGALTGLGDDDHTQYHNDTRGDARYLYRENVGAFTPDADYEPATKKYVDDNAGGVTDHGALTGLGDDDHSQYHNDTRGDARYYTETEMDGGQMDTRYYTETESDATFAPVAEGVTNGDTHDHVGGDGAQIDHGALGGLGDDDHTQYHNDTRGDARYYTQAQVDAAIPDTEAELEAELADVTDVYTNNDGIIQTTGSSFPGSPAEGELFYHTTHDVLFQYDGSGWNSLFNYGALSLYVDSGSGSDAAGQGYGSGADATATIQYAIDNCLPLYIGGTITANITAATYSEELVIAGHQFSGDYYIHFMGTLTNTTTGTATSGSVTTLTDTGASWGDMSGQFVRITSGPSSGQDRVILSNTTTVITLAGRFNPAPGSGSVYSVDVAGTIVSPGAGNTGAFLNAQSKVKFENIEFSGGTYGIHATNGSKDIEVNLCEFDTIGNGIYINSHCKLTINTAYIHDCTQAGFWATTASFAWIYDAYFDNNNTTSHVGRAGAAFKYFSWALFYRSYFDGNGEHGVLCEYQSSAQFLGSANISYIYNHTDGNGYAVYLNVVSSGAGMTTYTASGNTEDAVQIANGSYAP